MGVEEFSALPIQSPQNSERCATHWWHSTDSARCICEKEYADMGQTHPSRAPEAFDVPKVGCLRQSVFFFFYFLLLFLVGNMQNTHTL
jgi:hypothetical protein